jgi:hypothetical protein
LDDAIDSVRSSSLANGARAARATAFNSRNAFSASDTIAAMRASSVKSMSVIGSGISASYLHARRYFGGA